jgi:type II secretion system protein N
MPRALIVIIGAAWAAACFYMGLWLTFPGEQAAERLAWEIQESTKGAWQVQSSAIRPWWLSGATLKDVRVLSVPRSTSRDPDPTPALVLQADSVSARADLLALATGGQVAVLAADLYGGDIGGRVGMDGKSLVVDMEGSDLDLSRYPFGGDGWSVDVKGLLQADFDLTINQEDIKASEGKIDLEIEDLILTGVSVAGFNVEQAAEFETAVLKLEVEDGRARVKKGDFVSDLVEIEVGGDITLADPISRSRMNLTVTFKLADELDQMARLMLKNARDDSGKYHYKASGTLSSPRFREDRIASRGTERNSSSSDRGSRRSSSTPTTRAADREKEDAEDGGYRSARSREDDQEESGSSRRRAGGIDRRTPDRRRPTRDMEREPPPIEPPDGPEFIDDGPMDDEEYFDEEDEEAPYDDEEMIDEPFEDDEPFDR